MKLSKAPLPFSPQNLPRELLPFYLSANEQDLKSMLQSLGQRELKDVFSHLPQDVFFDTPKNSDNPPLDYYKLWDHLYELAQKSPERTSFIGDGLNVSKRPAVLSDICGIRGLTTAYTPYQPERGQGTLIGLYLYSSVLTKITGMEAINASLYDRSTSLFEALNTAVRLTRGKKRKVIVASDIFPGDKEVLETLAQETSLDIWFAPVDKESGVLCLKTLREFIENNQSELAGLAFEHINHFGLLSPVDALTDLATEFKLSSIAIIDPMALAEGGLKRPRDFGSDAQGVKMIVGEAQHLCLGPNFGGPGLGLFGIRFNAEDKVSLRSTPGRYVGKAQDNRGRECLSMVLSTREQHIRREKATSNICSNQSFVATLAGAGVLVRGGEGLKKSWANIRQRLLQAKDGLGGIKGLRFSFPSESPTHSLALSLEGKTAKELIDQACDQGLHLGVDISERLGHEGLLISFFDFHTSEDVKKLCSFLRSELKEGGEGTLSFKDLAPKDIRKGAIEIPAYSEEEILKYYQRLGQLNVSPDDNIYPLGSCTMKYNPHINDHAASLPGFVNLHPQAPSKDVQPALEILFEIQERFKAITGLPGVTTQPVAGAQGELVGLKMFQAYHRHNGEGESRNIILIPRSAHGTNPATAAMAGLETYKKDGMNYGIIPVDANPEGEIDLPKFKELVQEYGQRICGVMITNPNTCGVFESNFKEVAKLVHQAGGLVYMDGANMNAIAGHIDLDKLGVDAVHNNLHKTWTIPHGGGGPGDAIVAVSEKLLDFMPGTQVRKDAQGSFEQFKPSKSIGSFHRHHGNFAHKVRAYTYLRRLGDEGVKKMSAVAVLSSQYLFHQLSEFFPVLPASKEVQRMHEFIITLTPEMFTKLDQAGTPKAQAMARIGKLFLDFGLHAPTVAFPEPFGLMIEPTESFSKAELDRFVDVVKGIHQVLEEHPEVLTTAPHFTPTRKVDEVKANKDLILFQEDLSSLPTFELDEVSPKELSDLPVQEVIQRIVTAHKKTLENL